MSLASLPACLVLGDALRSGETNPISLRAGCAPGGNPLRSLLQQTTIRPFLPGLVGVQEWDCYRQNSVFFIHSTPREPSPMHHFPQPLPARGTHAISSGLKINSYSPGLETMELMHLINNIQGIGPRLLFPVEPCWGT
jgi:hypothetical protein